MEGLYQTAKQKSDFEFAAKLEMVELPKAKDLLDSVNKKISELEEKNSFLCQVVGHGEIAQVLSEWTGIEAERLTLSDMARLATMENRLRDRVFGQDEAVRSVVKAVKRAKPAFNDPHRPLGTFYSWGLQG